MINIISRYKGRAGAKLLLPLSCFLFPATASAQEVNGASVDSVAQKVNVAFRKVDKADIMGGVSSVDYEELAKKDNNTYSLDNMQGLVSGFNGASMWGVSDYLVLIDGVVGEATDVKPDEISQVTFLKGAQAVVLYGSRGAKGAVLITTKRGKTQPLSITASANTGWYVAKSYPEYLSSAEYMTLYNEARQNDGMSALYSAEDIYNYASGTNPYRYPNVNLYSSDYLKKSYNRSEGSVEFRGGGQRAKYYANVGYYRAGDFLNFGEAKNNYTDKFNVRGNVDMMITDRISAYVNAAVSFYSSHTAPGTDFWSMASTMRPNRVSPLIPASYVDENAAAANAMLLMANLYGNSFLGGTTADETNGVADSYASGKNTYNSRYFNFTAGLNFDLASILKGLSFKTEMTVKYATSYNTSYNNSYATYEPTWSDYSGTGTIVALTQHGTDKKSGVQNMSSSAFTQTIDFKAHFDYERTFNENHNVYAMLLANGYQVSKSGEYHKTSNANLGLLLNYNYAHKYYGEFGLAAVHSAKLAEGHREALSPSFTLGWNIAKEQFMENSGFDNLTLSASYSCLNQDIDIEDYYMYSGNFNQSDGAWWGWGVGDALHSVNSKRGANEDLGYIKRKEFSINLKGELLNKSLSFDMSYFTSKTTGLIITPTNLYPSYFSTYYPEASFIPYTNYDEDSRRGFEIGLNYKKKFGEFDFQAGVNFTYYTTEASKRDDSNYADTYQYRQGQALDALWGYECLGFFKDADDVKNSPSQTALGDDIQPGDLKYKDQNGDGIIDSKDQVCLGKGGWYGQPYTLGINLTGKYKGFTLFVLMTGGWGGHAFKSNSYWWCNQDSKYSAVVRGRWTTETADIANYPRLTTKSGSNNFCNSDFWLYSTSQFNLAKLQLTYDFPESLVCGKVVKGLSAFVSGSNLLCLAKNRDIIEMNVGSAPQTRFYQIGASVKF